MTNNDIIRRLRYSLNISDSKMIALFALAKVNVTKGQIIDWLEKEGNSNYTSGRDVRLASFLNGLIADRRGKSKICKFIPEKNLNNNIIFRKIVIALNFQSKDILNIISLANFKISKNELSAFFRKPEHKHFRNCKDQVLRKFLKGLQIKLRSSKK